MKRIYISDVIHQHLKREAQAEGRTLQWVVEDRLTRETPPSPKNVNAKILENGTVTKADPNDPYFAYSPELIKNNSGATPVTSDLFVDPLRLGEEKPCCANEFKPCSHWVWDSATGEGYINSLSGRRMEIE